MQQADNGPANKIFLIRHARPQVEKKRLYSKSAARQYLHDYDTAAVEEFVLQNAAIPYQEVKRVFCSTLIRSRLTAKAIFGEEVQLVENHNFREFERKVYSLPLLRLPINFWTLSARALWFMGLNSSGIETFKEAKERARACANTLIAEASSEKIAVLVAHGLLNHFIKQELRRKGWREVLKGGSSFVSVSAFEKHS